MYVRIVELQGINYLLKLSAFLGSVASGLRQHAMDESVHTATLLSEGSIPMIRSINKPEALPRQVLNFLLGVFVWSSD